MAVDPNNPNIVYVGTPLNGLFVTTNGGTTWQQVSQVPVSALDSNGDGDSPGITGILFDPAMVAWSTESPKPSLRKAMATASMRAPMAEPPGQS